MIPEHHQKAFSHQGYAIAVLIFKSDNWNGKNNYTFIRFQHDLAFKICYSFESVFLHYILIQRPFISVSLFFAIYIVYIRSDNCFLKCLQKYMVMTCIGLYDTYGNDMITKEFINPLMNFNTSYQDTYFIYLMFMLYYSMLWPVHITKITYPDTIQGHKIR